MGKAEEQSGVKVIEETQLTEEVERKLPFIVDIFLYPLNVSGIVNMGLFLFTPLLIGVVYSLVLNGIFLVGDFFALFLFALFFGYILYYLRLCVIGSSKGHLRAADVAYWQWPDKSELLSQFGMTLASIAVCFCPASLYFVLTERADIVFWFLFVPGFFFFPMCFLRVCLFDSFDSLNPVSIAGSIYTAFLPYLPLVLLFFIIALGCYFLLPPLPPAGDKLESILLYLARFVGYLASFRFAGRMVAFFYLAMIASHLLGRFYWFNKHKLNWGL